MQEIDAVMHFGAARTREGLADTEEFLILAAVSASIVVGVFRWRGIGSPLPR
jgi:hypothetical protein